MRLLIGVTLALGVGCATRDGKPAAVHNQGSQEAVVTPAWSDPVDGIRIRLDPPRPSAKPGESLTMTLVVHNTSDKPRRIYMLGPEVFRSTLSDFWLVGDDGKLIGPPQPEPHPHGYLPTEADFPLIAAGAEQRFQQTLAIPQDAPRGTATVRWRMSNRVKRMEGGLQTLDGPTKPLFGGGDIPDIWLGEVKAQTTITIE